MIALAAPTVYPNHSRLHPKKIFRKTGLDFKETSITILARIGNVYRDPLEDSSRFLTDNQDVLREKHGLTDAVGHEEDRFAGFLPNTNQFLPQLARRQVRPAR